MFAIAALKRILWESLNIIVNNDVIVGDKIQLLSFNKQFLSPQRQRS